MSEFNKIKVDYFNSSVNRETGNGIDEKVIIVIMFANIVNSPQ